MNHQETVREISRRLPRLKRRDVAEVLEVMGELWQSALSQPGQSVTVVDLGKLEVRVQPLRSAGTVRQKLENAYGTAAPQTLKRVYIRFRPSERLREAILAGVEEESR